MPRQVTPPHRNGTPRNRRASATTASPPGDPQGGTGRLRVGLREQAHLPVRKRDPEAAHLLGLHDEHGAERGLAVAAE